jgi:hypothetical protein
LLTFCFHDEQENLEWHSFCHEVSGDDQVNIFSFILYKQILLKFFKLCLGYIMAFTKVLIMYQIYHTWIHCLHYSPLFPLPHSWNSFNRSHFSIYIYVYPVFVPYSPSYTHFLHPPHNGTNPPDRTCSFLQFCKRKKWHFCLFKIPIQGVSLWHFHVHMYYNLIWFISVFLPSTLVPLWWFQQV